MPYSPEGKNAMLDHLGTLAGYASLHSADSGTTGANELTGGSPAYARKATSWAAASAGSKSTNAAMTFDVPAGTVSHFGLWNVATGGLGPVFYAGGALSASETYAAQGTYTLNTVTINLNAV